MLQLAEAKAERLRARAEGGRAGDREYLERAEALLRRNQLAWQQTDAKRQRLSQELRAVRRDLAVLEALVDLVTVWAPACFALGWRVRDCHWEHRAPMTGAYARETLRTSLLLLLCLEGPGRGESAPLPRAARPPKPQPRPQPSAAPAVPAPAAPVAPSRPAPRGNLSEYVRTLSCALLLWTLWHDALPACCYSEELNEAALGRLGHSMRRHPDATSADAVMDLWLRVKPGRTGFKNIRPGGVDARWRRMSLENVDRLLARCDPSECAFAHSEKGTSLFSWCGHKNGTPPRAQKQ